MPVLVFEERVMKIIPADGAWQVLKLKAAGFWSENCIEIYQ
jgi:hypothetical protein